MSLHYSAWAGTATAIRAAYPGIRLSMESITSTVGKRVLVEVANPPAALLADYRFPQLRQGDDPTSFTGYQNAMLDAVGLYAAAQLAAGFTYQSVTYPLDQESRQQWLGLLTLSAALTFPLHVTSLDGKTVTARDQAMARGCAQTALAAYLAITQAAAQTRAAVLAATTAAGLDAITIGA